MDNKLELLKIAMDLYPCPLYNGAIISLDVCYTLNKRKILFIYKSNRDVDFMTTCHILRWVIKICKFTNVDYNKVLIDYE